MSDEYSLLEHRLESVILGEGEVATIRSDDGVETIIVVEGGSLKVTDDERSALHPSYDAVFVREQTLRLEVFDSSVPGTARTWVIDFATGQAVCVASELQPEHPYVQHSFQGGALTTVDGTRSRVVGPTRELIGRRALCRYSSDLLFEQIYLNTGALAWQDLSDDAGRSGADPATYWKIASDLYVIGFREPAFRTGSLFVLDLRAGRSTATFLSSEDDEIRWGRLGGLIHELERVTYPSDVVPA